MLKKKLKRITVKVGTKVLTDKHNRLDLKVIKGLADQAAGLMDRGVQVILVSSGAIGAGLGLLDIEKKGRSLSELQAIASIGQSHLMSVYNKFFEKKGYVAGQILLTQEYFNDRRRFLNIRYTLNALLNYRAVPIINENDSIATDELKCGDNDRLSSLVADLADSDMLIILTDVDGLYDENGRVIEKVEKITAGILSLDKGKGSEESTGGMMTKLSSVRNAAHSGIPCVIARGRRKNVILEIVDGKGAGTVFEAHGKPLQARKRWIAFSLKPKGSITVDSGAERAIVKSNRSLLASGVLNVSGRFSDGDVIDVLAEDKRLIARGLSNYSCDEIKKIKGIRSDRIESELGYKDYDEIIHRDNLVILTESGG
ncbi:MAG: glutamate 5-kinase [Candidatus Omnitrophota bacterium]